MFVRFATDSARFGYQFSQFNEVRLDSSDISAHLCGERDDPKTTEILCESEQSEQLNSVRFFNRNLPIRTEQMSAGNFEFYLNLLCMFVLIQGMNCARSVKTVGLST